MNKKELQSQITSLSAKVVFTERSLENATRDCNRKIHNLESRLQCYETLARSLHRELSKRVKSIEDKLPRNLACPNCQSENTEKLTEVLGGADDYVCKTCGIYFRGLV